MKEQRPANHFAASWWLYLSAVLAAAYVLINAFTLGGNAFVFNLNGNAANPLALGVALLSFQLARSLAGYRQNRLVWGGLALGWLFWAVAEIWWGVAGWIGQEAPFPSWADLFWVLGYLPIIGVMAQRIQSLPRITRSAQKFILWASGFLSLAFTAVFVLLPILRHSDPARLAQDALNLLYPILDLVLLLQVLQTLFLYQRGAYGRVWGWLSAGFILHSLANLVFSYASTAGIYYPDGRVNWISGLFSDVPYNLAYLLWIIGLVFMRRLQKGHQPLDRTFAPPKLAPNAHFLIFTKGDDTVISVSANFTPVFGEGAPEGKTLAEALGISPAAMANLLREIKANNLLQARDCLVTTQRGPRQAEISGITVHTPLGEYAGCMLLVRMVTDDYSLDGRLTEYQKGVVRSLIVKTEIKEEEEVKQLLSAYYQAYLKSFYNRVYAEGGSIMAEAFMSSLQAIARQRGWQINLQARAMLNVSALSLAETQAALPVMLEAAEKSLEKITEDGSAAQIAAEVRAHFDEATLQNIAYFEKREVVVAL